MKNVKHTEQHFTESEFIGDVVIGIADGLTVPFALAAGLSGTVSNTSLVVIAGISEIAAGSIAMGLGGYLAARTNREHYLAEKEREYREIREVPHKEEEEVAEFLREWGLKEKDVQSAVEDITSDDDRWVNFMMKYELELEEPKPERARNSSLTIGMSYIFGGLIPLSPYIFINNAKQSLMASVIITLAALFTFGWVKGKFTGTGAIKSALQTALVGGLAAGFAFALAKLIS